MNRLLSESENGRVQELRHAADLIQQHANNGRLKTSVLHGIGQLILDIEGAPSRECCECGTPFSVGERELHFYRSRGLSIPRRCRACRQQRRHERAEREQAPPDLERM